MRVSSLPRAVLAIAALLLMAGCSNGSSSVQQDDPSQPSAENPPTQPEPAPDPTPLPPGPQPEPDPDPEPPSQPLPASAALDGYWRGSVKQGNSGDNQDSIAFVTAQGEAQLLVLPRNGSQFVLKGNLCCAASVEERMRALRRGTTRAETSSLTAGLSGSQWAGDFEFRDRDYRYALSRDAGSNAALSLPLIAGVYSGSGGDDDDDLSTIAINADGQVTGALPDRCAFSGTVSIPHPSRNMLQFNVSMTACRFSRYNGAYTGLGVMTGAGELTVSLIGPTWLGAQALRK